MIRQPPVRDVVEKNRQLMRTGLTGGYEYNKGIWGFEYFDASDPARFVSYRYLALFTGMQEA